MSYVERNNKHLEVPISNRPKKFSRLFGSKSLEYLRKLSPLELGILYIINLKEISDLVQ